MKRSILLFLFLAVCAQRSFSQSVGTTEGVFNVSDMGAANYSVPIKVPDGINGMQPSLALVYSSQGGNGPLGMGWSISGLSAITRTGNTIYHDSKVNGISLTGSDRFALDGNRLMVTSGAYGASASKYRTEVETFKDITANGTLGTGPQSFTVTDQNGWTYEYGNTADSRQVPVGKTEAVTWYLNKVKDLNGNYITYEYNNVDGDVLPKYVKYNSNQNTGLAYQTYVSFSYTNKPDPNISYIAGGSIKTAKRINKISVIQKVNSSWYYYRSYTPEYSDDTYTHLTKITEKGTNETEALPPMEFTYGETAVPYTATNVWSSGANPTSYDFATGDFNGDGKTDLIQYCRYYSDCNSWAMYESTGSNFNQIQTASFPTPSSQYTKKENIPRNFFSTFFDYNGDGKEDFVYKSVAPNQSTSGSTGDQKDLYSILLSNGSFLTSIASPKPGSANGQVYGESFIDTYPLTGDFDGDGKTEILAIRKYIYSQYNTYIIGENYTKPCTGGTGCNAGATVATPLSDFPFISSYTSGLYAAPNPNEQPKIMVTDYNGDGKSDILYINQGTAYIYTMNVTFDANNKPIIGNPSFKLVNSTGYPTIWHKYINVGDFNGDGKSDVLTYSTNTGWEIGYGKGDGLMNDIKPLSLLTSYTQGFSTSNDVITPVIVSDFNGDGKTDIYAYPRANATVNSSTPFILYSKGNNEFYGESLSSAVTKLGKEPYDYFLGDFTGDGQMDFITKYPGSWPFYEFSFHPNETRHLLSKVKEGLGAETGVNYLSLTHSSVYTSGSNNYTYPYIKRTIPFKVVSKVISDNGVNSTGNATTYTYLGLRFHAQGKGLLGFEKVSGYDVQSHIKTEKNFGLNTSYAFPFLQSSFAIAISGNNFEEYLNGTSNAYGIYSYGNKRIFPYQTEIAQNNYLTGETTITTNNYVFPTGPYVLAGVTYSHNIGKPFSITTNKGYGLDITTQTFTYPNSSTFTSGGTTYAPVWVYSRPSKVVTTHTRQGQPAYSRTATFTYDNTTGRLTKTVSDPGTSVEVSNQFYYYADGNLKDKYTFGVNVPLKQEKMEYDASSRYVTKSYFASHPAIQNNATYDGLTGSKLTETAPDGFKTTYTYDAFGRLKTTNDNNGLSTTTIYNWGYSLPGDNTVYSGATYYVSTTSNTGAVTHTLYDRLGREIKNRDKNFQGEWVNSIRKYNIKGQLASVSKPYFDNASPQYINYSYDAYGRQTQVAAPEGNTTYTYGYANSSGTIASVTNPAGQTTSVKTDPSGIKISTTDAQNNTLNYVYHSNGNVKSVTGAGTTLQTYTYDAYNRLAERWDPNYGTYKYTYDAYGQTLSQNDPRNQTYTFKYDGLGRMYQKTGPEGNYDYTFEDNAGTNCGKMIRLTGPEGAISYDYGMGDKTNSATYDDYGIFIGSLEYRFEYDSYGRPAASHNFLGTSIRYGYGSNGSLTTIENQNTGAIFYQKQSENAVGQITSYRQKNFNSGYELTTTHTYDPYNLISGQKTVGNASNTLRDVKYNFDPASGNLLSREDNKYGLQETFGYDNLNRLTSITNSNNPVLNIGMQFSINGNIEEKTDAGGSFEYDQANRVSTINLNTAQPQNIPHAMQELSYTPFDKVSAIEEGGCLTEFRYWPDGSRSMMITTNNVTGQQEYKIYAPDAEYKYNTVTGEESYCTYIKGPDGNTVGMATAGSNGDYRDYFVLTDHLGSFTQIVDEQGSILEEKSFDAWGRLRDPQNWEPYASNIEAGQPQQLFDRGYTGHEHLPYYGIINMNGRLYDPVMGRMFSPDPVMGSGSSLQGYNRYTYALNNPLKYNDPTGEWIQFVIGAVVGGTINVVLHWNKINSFGDGLVAFGIGAGAGVLAVATGGAAFTAAGGAAGGIGGFGAGAIGGGVGSAFNYTAQGIGNSLYFKDPPPTVEGLAINTLIGGGTGGLLNGIPAAINGRNFWNGTFTRQNIPILEPLSGTIPGVSINQNNPQANTLRNATGNGQVRLNFGGDVKSIDYGKVYGKLLSHGFSKGHDGVLQFGNGNTLGTMNNAVSVIEQVQGVLQNGPNQIMVNYNGSQYIIRCFAQNGVVVGANIFPNSPTINTKMIGNIINYTFKP